MLEKVTWSNYRNKDEDKLIPVSDHLVMGASGEPGDIIQFTQFVAKNLSLYRTRNGYPLDAAAAAHFTRKTLADYLKNGTPYLMNFLLGGWDEINGGQLYYMDSLASCARTPFAAHGFGGLFCISVLEYHHKRDMTEAQAYEVLQMCVKEVHNRLFLNLPTFQVKIISKNGITTLPIVYTPHIVASPGLQMDVKTGDSSQAPQDEDKEKKKQKQINRIGYIL